MLNCQASIAPYRAYKTKDGDILFGGGNDRLFCALCDRLSHPEWKTDPKVQINPSRVVNRELLDSSIETITSFEVGIDWDFDQQKRV